MGAADPNRVPGRLFASPEADPRTKPALKKVMSRFGAAGPAARPNIDKTDFPAVLSWVAEADRAWGALYEAVPNDLPLDRQMAKVSTTSVVITGDDGHEIELRITRPEPRNADLPCAIYLHGGGMTILAAFNKVHTQWREDLARAGMVVVGVNFRNAYTANGLNPFPAGLTDCLAALRWVDDNRAAIGVSSIILTGESGGGNLALATSLTAKHEGEIGRVDGVYAVAPTISGAYSWDAERRAEELPSLVECDGYVISVEQLTLMCAPYDPKFENAENPLCWPYWAGAEDLQGLPPHVISVAELDPMRDEGIAYARRLQHAGVSAIGRVNLGLVHVAEVIYRQAIPEEHFAAIADIHRFASTL